MKLLLYLSSTVNYISRERCIDFYTLMIICFYSCPDKWYCAFLFRCLSEFLEVTVYFSECTPYVCCIIPFKRSYYSTVNCEQLQSKQLHEPLVITVNISTKHISFSKTLIALRFTRCFLSARKHGCIAHSGQLLSSILGLLRKFAIRVKLFLQHIIEIK